MFDHAPPPIQELELSERVTLKSWRVSDKQQRLALLLITLVAFALRLLTIDFQSLWRDEVDAIWFALRPLEQTVAMFTQMAQNGALYFLGLRPWLSTMGSSEFALRFPSALAGVAAIPMIWLLARKLVGNGVVPLLASFLLAINHYAVWYSQDGNTYTIITFLALVASWCWIKGVEVRAWRWWIGYVIVISLAMYTHLLAILIVPVHMVWFVIAFPSARKVWARYGIALAFLTLPYLPMLIWQWAMLRANYPVTGFSYTPIAEMVKTILLNQARGFMPGDPIIWLTPIWFLLAVGAVLGFTEVRDLPLRTQSLPISPNRRFGMVLGWFVVPVLLIWFISLRQPVFTDRYIMWNLPAALILIALGAQVIRANLGQWGAPIAIATVFYVALLWVTVDWQQSSNVIKYDLRGAVREVSAARDPDDLLVLQIPHLEYAYRYYSSDQGTDPFAESDARLGNWRHGLWTNTGTGDEEARAVAAEQMGAMTRGTTEAWVIQSEAEMWDTRRLMDEWLASRAAQLSSNNYHGVRVRHYALPREP